jgi:hypothetical protein
MSYSLRFHKLVQYDFSNAYEWYENKSHGLGERFIEAVKDKLDDICHLPEANSEKYRKGFREARVDIFPFVIVYKIMPSQTIFVSTIHHVKKHSRSKYRKP